MKRLRQFKLIISIRNRKKISILMKEVLRHLTRNSRPISASRRRKSYLLKSLLGWRMNFKK